MTLSPVVSDLVSLDRRGSRLSWDDYFMSLALLSAKRSKDPQTQVGACIVSEDKKIVGIGYNGFPHLGPISNDDCLPWGREGKSVNSKYPYVCHAEMNAVMNKNQQDIRNCTIYTTLFPCNECAKILIQSGIKEVVFLSDSKASQPSMIASRKMLDAVGVMCRQHVVSGITVPLVGDGFSMHCSYVVMMSTCTVKCGITPSTTETLPTKSKRFPHFHEESSHRGVQRDQHLVRIRDHPLQSQQVQQGCFWPPVSCINSSLFSSQD